MGKPIHNPHDKLFKKTFSEKQTAIAFFEAYLPNNLVKHIQFETLKLVPANFIDEEFKEFQSDVIFQVKIKNKISYLYILFEHQTRIEPLFPFRLLRYKVKIWDELVRKNRNLKLLPPILPILLHQGEKSWNISTEFIDILDLDLSVKKDLSSFLPNFKHILIDLPDLKSNEILLAYWGRLAWT